MSTEQYYFSCLLQKYLQVTPEHIKEESEQRIPNSEGVAVVLQGFQQYCSVRLRMD